MSDPKRGGSMDVESIEYFGTVAKTIVANLKEGSRDRALLVGDAVKLSGEMAEKGIAEKDLGLEAEESAELQKLRSEYETNVIRDDELVK